MNSIQKELSDLQIEFNLPQSPKLELFNRGGFGHSIQDSFGGTIYLNPLTIIQPQDFPAHLQVLDPQDPRLSSDAFYAELGSWIEEKFNLPTIQMHKLKTIHNWVIRIHNHPDPQMLQRARRFALAHECSHIFLEHEMTRWEKIPSFALMCLSIHLLLSNVPLWVVGIGAYTTYSVSIRFFGTVREYYHLRPQEKEADLKALSITKDFEAAKVFFETLDEASKKTWNERPFSEKIDEIFSTPSTLIPWIHHPTPQERIAYLQEAAQTSSYPIEIA